MSREFGNYGGSGYFHNKLSDASDDARGGHTRGAKIMLAFLEPLAEIAYAVSSEEACDSSESRVVETGFKKMQELKDAMYALKEFCEPARNLAVEALIETLKDTAIVTEIEARKQYSVETRVSIPWDLSEDVVCGLARMKFRTSPMLHCNGWTSSDKGCFHHVHSWDSKSRGEQLFKENEKLKQRVAFLESQVTSKGEE